MRELTVRALLHSAALGRAGDAAAGILLAAEIDNPVMQAVVEDGTVPHGRLDVDQRAEPRPSLIRG
jgi:hypothetical protein